MASRYVEPGRTYTTTLVLLAILVAGFVADLTFIGGGRTHLLGWLVAIVVVVGIDALAAHAARTFRTITITDAELRVGEDAIPRAEIVAVESDPDPSLPVLGRRYGDGVPRSMVAVAVHLAGGERRVVATRHPDRLVAALDVGRSRPVVRPAEPSDLPLLASIDERAETLFRVYGFDLPQIPLSVDAMHEAKAVFVAGRPPLGFLQVDEVDGLAHVQALAVLPSQMRQGLGSSLLEAACAWARDRGYPAITLCAYADIPWNGPYYLSRGFTETADVTPGLAELRAWERDVGLDDLGRRCVMRRELPPPSARATTESRPTD